MPARRRIPLNRSTSGVRAPPAAFSSRRPCPQRADDPSGGRRSDGGKDAEGRVRNGRPTILPRPDGKRPVRPPPHSRPAAKKRRTEKIVGYAEAPYVPAGGRTAHSSGHRIGGRSPAGARPPRGREASAPTAIPNTVFGATRDDRRAGFCTIRKYRHFYTPESALFRSDRGAMRHRRGRISGRGSLGKEYRYAGHCRPTASYIGPAPTRLNVPASGGGASEAGRIGPDDNSAGSPPADRPVPHSQAEQTLLSASVTFRDTTDVPSVLSPNTGFRRQANGAPVLRPERTKVVDPRRGHCPTRHGFDQKRRTPAVVSVRPAVRAPFQTERKKQIEAARSVSSTAVEVPSEHAYSAASCNLEWQTTKTRQANESFAAASGEPLIRGKIRKLYRSKRGCLKFVRQPLFDREVVPPGIVI